MASSSLALLCLVLMAVAYSSAAASSCTYGLEVETKCSKDAGTTDAVKVKIGDRNGTFVERTLEKGSLVQPCKVNNFTFTDHKECLSEGCQLFFFNTGTDMLRVRYTDVYIQGEHRAHYVLKTNINSGEWVGDNICNLQMPSVNPSLS